MNARLPVVILVGVLMSGCQSPTPVVVAPVVVPTATAAAPNPTDTEAETIAFLNTLTQTVDAQRHLDADAARRYRALLGDDPQILLYRLAEGKPVLHDLPRATSHAVTTIEVAHEAASHKLWDALAPAPPSCQTVLRHCHILLTEQINRDRRIVAEVNGALLAPGNTPAVSLRNNAEYGYGYATTRQRRIAQLTQAFERVRTASPTLLTHVPPLPVAAYP